MCLPAFVPKIENNFPRSNNGEDYKYEDTEETIIVRNLRAIPNRLPDGGTDQLPVTRDLATHGTGAFEVTGVGGSINPAPTQPRWLCYSDSIAEGWTVLSGEARYRYRAVEFALQVDNLLDTPWREVQFANESRLQDEPEPVEDIHFTPGWPLTAIASVTVFR